MDSMTVLIVEGDKNLRSGMERILTNEGFKVYGVADGMVGLDFLRNHNYDLVLLDVYLPRLSGMQLLRYMKRYKLAKRVIILTATSEMKIGQEAVRIGADDILVKPFDLKSLLNCISRVLTPDNQKKVTAAYN
ncbi:MAG: response regulator [Ignavibacteriales bacterium]|nr:response regulator [Ignavibacteriales bacterium]